MGEQRQVPCPADDNDELRRSIVGNVTEHQFLGAGAGAGKTTVLVDHYFHLLKDGCRPAELVAVTFTDKAAAEMKSRLREQCRREARDARIAGADDADRWEGLIYELETAPISTIHGYCARLLREHSLAAGLDPDFTVFDEVDAQILLDSVVRQTLLSRLGQEETANDLMVELNYDIAVEAITKLVQDRVRMAGVLRNELYGDQLALQERWSEWLCAQLEQGLSEVLEHPDWHPHLQLINEHPGPSGDSLTGLQEQLQLVIRECGLLTWSAQDLNAERMRAMVKALKRLHAVRAPGNWGRAADWQASGCSKETMAAAQACFTHGQGSIALLIKDLMALENDPALDETCARTTCALVAEVKSALEAYQAAKDQRSALDFEDLMERTRQLWEMQPATLARIAASLKHVMIDEFQDTNRLQKQVLWPLATGEPYDADLCGRLPQEGPRLFVVGDVKQSIYRFRGADVTVFNATREEMTSEANRVDELTRNFRSTHALIDVYNALFSDPAVMGTEVAEAYEAAYARMEADRDAPPTGQVPMEVHLLTEPRTQGGGADDDGSDEAGLRAMREQEADWIAQRLVRLLNSGECVVQRSKDEGGQWEPARPGDIAILFRSMSDVAIYERALRRAELPYYLVVGRGFFSAQEVQDLVQALQAIENGLDDVALVGALRSPLSGLSDETLYWLAQLGSGSWWWRLRAAVHGPDDETQRAIVERIACDQRRRLDRAREVLESLRHRKDRLGLAALVQELLDRTGFTAVLAAQLGGRQMVGNARKLVELAGEFEAEHQVLGQGGLRSFIEYLTRMTAEEVREGQAPVEEEAGDSIKLITYHSAKGLQWPIVVVADLCRKRGGDCGPRYRFHDGLGVVVSTTFLMKKGKDTNYWPPLAGLIKDRNDAEEEAEQRRLFYVAATRAQDLLVLSGVTQLTADQRNPGAVFADARKGPLGWVNEALAGVLWSPAGNEASDAVWGWQNGTLARIDETFGESATYDPKTSGDAVASASDITGLAERLAAVPPANNGQRRFTPTDLSLYDFCPRLYELERRMGLPGVAPSLGRGTAHDALSAMETGLVVHRVLQLVGTGGQAELDRLVQPDAEVLRIDTLLDRRAARVAGQIRERVQRFLESPLYGDLFVSANRLRSEAGLAFILEVNGQDVVIEGKIDALIETADGQRHLIDYKTGEHDDRHHEQYAVQLGLYCHAVEQATGKLPASAALVYLSENSADVRQLDVATTTEHAMAAARQAVEGIWAGDFHVRGANCGYCVAHAICRSG